MWSWLQRRRRLINVVIAYCRCLARWSTWLPDWLMRIRSRYIDGLRGKLSHYRLIKERNLNLGISGLISNSTAPYSTRLKDTGVRILTGTRQQTMTDQDACQRQDEVDHSSQASRVVVDNKGRANLVCLSTLRVWHPYSLTICRRSCWGHAVKPIPKRKAVEGEREVEFYRLVFSSSEPEHVQWRGMVLHFYGVQTPHPGRRTESWLKALC